MSQCTLLLLLLPSRFQEKEKRKRTKRLQVITTPSKVLQNIKSTTVFPNDDEKILKFTNIQKQLKAPFVVYADLESRLIDTTTKDDDISTKTFIREDIKGACSKSSKKEKKREYLSTTRGDIVRI